MKKIIFALVLMMMAALSANAQDDFFRSEDGYRGTPVPGVDEPLVPHGPLGGAMDQDAAPLGSGLLVLTALGAGYLVRKKH